jgi:predicted SAM-dependent methyltransferase
MNAAIISKLGMSETPVLPSLRQVARPIWRAVHGAYRAARTTVEAGVFILRARVASDLRIVVGSSGQFEPGWIATEYQYLNLLVPLHWERAFGKRKLDAIVAEHVFEHLTAGDGLIGIRTCAQFLKPGGYLRIAVPDGFSPDPEYIDRVRPGGTGPGSDDHKVLYNIDLLASMLRKCGLTPVPLEYYSADGNFHYEDWNPSTGKISRSRRFDERNADGILRYTSLIVDGVKVT